MDYTETQLRRIGGYTGIITSTTLDTVQLQNGEVPALLIRMPRASAEKLCGMLPQFVYTLADCIEGN